jgi:DeoR family glycerol-3-phosphate regulon repressor
MVITNNLNVASLMRAYPRIEVVVAGGVVRHADAGIIGEAAVDFIRQFKVDFAVIGASAIDEDGALLDYDYSEVRVAQAIISNARHVMLVCDATKFERSAPVRIAHISQVNTFVTDRCTSESVRRVCAESAVELVETASPAEAEHENGEGPAVFG